MDKTYDCAGWATRANMLCSDGRTIRKNAFEECDGKIVPLVWNHEHNDPNAVLGHALLKNRDDGVYAYLTFNDTDAGQNAKLLVQHKDVDRLSIWANKLKQMGSDVIHGVIREVSLVLAGANPGAVIDTVLTIDSKKVDAQKLAKLEDILYGSAEAEARLPLPDEIATLMAADVAA